MVDGDTIVAGISGVTETVRLLGINAPEKDECHAGAATAQLMALLEGRELRVEPAEGEARDDFGRLLAYVEAGDAPVNEALIRAGAAVSLYGDHPRAGSFDEAMDEAWRERAGMWSSRACGPPTTARLEIGTVVADPRGDDNEFANAEQIQLVNPGPAVDLGGWIVRDESSSNRYRFPAGTVLDAGAALVVHSGCGVDTPTAVFTCTGPIWSNGGDTVMVQTPEGNVAARKTYRNR